MANFDRTNDFENESDAMGGVSDVSDLDEPSTAVTGPAIRRSLEGKFVCPFCGSINHRTDEPCPKCGMENTPSTRNSTRARIGPWYVLQKRNPSAPGMKFDTLVRFIAKGRINPRTIVRGPTTTQLWRFAATVKGLSREFGLCYNCGGDVDRNTINCPQCGRDQQPPPDPDVLIESRSAAAATSSKPESAADMFADQVIGSEQGFVDSEQPVRASVAPPTPQPRRVPPPKGAGPVAAPASAAAPVPPAAPKAPATPFTASPVRTTLGTAPLPSNAARPGSMSAQEQREAQDRREIEEGRIAREAEPRDLSKPMPMLSARELATAFQLDFNEPNGSKRHRKHHRPRGKGVYVLLTVLILAGAGVAAYLKVPVFKEGVDSLYASTTAKVQELTKPAPAAKPPANNPNVNAPVDPMAVKPSTENTIAKNPTSPTNSTPANPSPTNTTLTNATPANPVPTNTTSSNAASSNATSVVPTNTVAVPSNPANSGGTSTQVTRIEPNTAVKPPAPKLTADEANELSRKLWRQAFDSEAKQDWASAVAAYEQIKTLPKQSWPGALDFRLNEAKQRAKQ